jgi:hypothetical protein
MTDLRRLLVSWSLMPGLDREHRKQEKRHAG